MYILEGVHLSCSQYTFQKGYPGKIYPGHSMKRLLSAGTRTVCLTPHDESYTNKVWHSIQGSNDGVLTSLYMSKRPGQVIRWNQLMMPNPLLSRGTGMYIIWLHQYWNVRTERTFNREIKMIQNIKKDINGFSWNSQDPINSPYQIHPLVKYRMYHWWILN